ncbi:unnamed protein product [Symbiodinium microadriaticum]|nr:unnamed protein product [Symbiodinium microadriaticum]
MDALLIALQPHRALFWLGAGAGLCVKGGSLRQVLLVLPFARVADAKDVERLLDIASERLSSLLACPKGMHRGLWQTIGALAFEALLRAVDVGVVLEVLWQGTFVCTVLWLAEDDSSFCSVSQIYPAWRSLRSRCLSFLRRCLGDMALALLPLERSGTSPSSRHQLRAIVEQLGLFVILTSHRSFSFARVDWAAGVLLSSALGIELLQRAPRAALEASRAGVSWLPWHLWDASCIGFGLWGAGRQIFRALSPKQKEDLKLVPPVPLCRPGAGDSGNWPLLTSTKKIFEKSSFEAAAPPPMPGSEAFLDAEENPEDTEGLGGGAWGEEETALDLGADMGGGDWGGDLDLGDLGGLLPASTEPQEEERGLNLTLADSCQVKWLRKRRLPADLVAAGDFEEALGLLKRRLGLMNAEPLEPIFKQAYWATCTSLPSLPQMVSINWPLLSEGSIKSREIAPMVLFTPQVILERVKEAHKMTSAGKFNDALAAFRSALQSIPISVANDANEERQLTDMIEMCREYVTFARLQVTSKKLTPDKAARQIELNAYLTCCKLQQFHQFLTLKTAMGIAFKNENFVTAASFAKRMIQGNFGPADKHKDDVQKARQVLQICEQKGIGATRSTLPLVELIKGHTLSQMAEPAAKKAKVEKKTFEEQRKAVAEEKGREELLDGLFEAWDYDGSGTLTLEEILPFYMKSSQKHDVLEPQVRSGFEKFCSSQGIDPAKGLDKAVFKKWLSKLSEEQLAAHYVRHVQGWTDDPYKMNMNLAVIKDFRGKSIKEILDSPVHAIRGLSGENGEATLEKLGIKTVRELAGWRVFLLARAIVTMAPTENTDEDDKDASGPSAKMNIRNMLDAEYETAPLKQVLDLPVSALSILPPEGVEVLASINIRTIKHLGTRKYFHWANAILELEQYEA